MTLEAAALICAGVLAVVLGLLRRRRPDSPWAGVPLELRRIRPVYAEQLFRSSGTVSIAARVDRAYRGEAGTLVLVELKTRTRSRGYPSDVMELSAQRLALMGQTGEAVAEHAYVLTERPDGCRTGCHRVRLMAHADVIALVRRREDLLAAKIEPQPACSRGLCRKCVFVQLCDFP